MKDKRSNDSENYEGEDLEMTDQFDESSENNLVKHGKKILIAAVGLIAIVGIMLYFNHSGKQKDELASKELSRIKVYFDQQEYTRALAGGDSVPTVRGDKVMGLLDIANTYGSTSSGKLAALLAAESLSNLNDYAQAKLYFEKATSSSAELIKRGAYAGLGVCFEKEENYRDAAKNYETASELSVDASGKGRYMLYAALCYEKMGEKDKAEALLMPLIKDMEYFEFANLAKSAMVRLGTIIE